MLVEWLWILVTSNVKSNSVRRKPRACERRLKNWSSGPFGPKMMGTMMGEWWNFPKISSRNLMVCTRYGMIWVYSQVPKFFFKYFGIIVIPDFWRHPIQKWKMVNSFISWRVRIRSLIRFLWIFDFSGGIQMLDGWYLWKWLKCAVGRCWWFWMK